MTTSGALKPCGAGELICSVLPQSPLQTGKAIGGDCECLPVHLQITKTKKEYGRPSGIGSSAGCNVCRSEKLLGRGSFVKYLLLPCSGLIETINASCLLPLFLLGSYNILTSSVLLLLLFFKGRKCGGKYIHIVYSLQICGI